MKKASASFLVLFFASLLVSFQSFAQSPSRGQSETLRETVNQNLRSYERLRLGDLLRLSRQEENRMELVSLTLMAETILNAPAQLQLMQNGRALVTENVRKQLKEVRMVLPAGTLMEGLELSPMAEIYIQSITAEVIRSRPGPGPGPGPGPIPGPGPGRQQVAPNAFVSLQVNQMIRGYAQLDLEQLVRQQFGLTLRGAQIERVIIQGQPLAYGRAASVQVELNNRPVGQVRYLSTAQRQTPIPLNSMEEVRNLSLIVSGDAQIQEVRIRVGQVRPELPELPQMQRVLVNQEVNQRMPLELSRLLSYEQRLIRSVTIQARGIRNAPALLELAGIYGEIQGQVYVSSGIKHTVMLRRPMAAHELRLQSTSAVLIEALEIEFEQYPRY